jgi:hypothetical protein
LKVLFFGQMRTFVPHKPKAEGGTEPWITPRDTYESRRGREEFGEWLVAL